MDAGDQRHPVVGARSQRRALGDLEDPAVVLVDLLAIGLAHVVPHLRVLRHHVGRTSAGGDHVVDAGLGSDVLAHQVHAVVHQLDGVQSAPPVPWVG